MPSVLVVEDEALIADDIQRTLTRVGYDVPTTAATGREAIRAVEQQRPSLVLMDIKLRGSMDGIEAASEIRRRFGVPVVYLTSHSDEDTLARARATASSGYLIKPFNERELRASIEIALGAHAVSRESLERARRFERALEVTRDAVLVVDESERVVFVNEPAESLTGWACREAVSRRLSDVLMLIPTRDGRERVASRLDGTMRDVVRRQLPVTDGDGQRVGEVVVLHEVGAVASGGERMQAIGRIASAMGHELNNPLAAVVASAWFARDLIQEVAYRTPADADVQFGRERFAELEGALTDVHDGAERARRVVNHLRRLVVSKAPATRTVAASKLLADALQLATLEGIVVEQRLEDAPVLDVDDTQIAHALACLVDNAADAARAAGQAAIEVTIGTDATGHARFEVLDRAAGVSSSIRARVFEPFFSTKRRDARLGLGLTVAEHAIHEARGALTLEARDGGGTVARVTLPPAIHSVPPPTAHPSGGGPRPRVLVVDDEPAVTRSMKRSLQGEFDVVVARSGEEAFALLSGETSFDVVFTDVLMPDLPGDELYRRVQARAPDVASRFVFVTGGGLSADTERCIASSGRPLVTKPFVPSAVRAIAHAVANPGAGAGTVAD